MPTIEFAEDMQYGICKRCGGEANEELRTCPFAEDVFEDIVLCNCCDSCRDDCADDI